MTEQQHIKDLTTFLEQQTNLADYQIKYILFLFKDYGRTTFLSGMHYNEERREFYHG